MARRHTGSPCADCWDCSPPPADAPTRAEAVGQAMRCAAAPRTGRTRHLARRGRRLRVQPAVDHRHRALAPAAALGSAERPIATRSSFNGEIYNYLELRDELAASYGATFAHRRRRRGDRRRATTTGAPTAVRRLRGMFAFLIWDTAGARAVRRARPVRHQAAVRRRPAPAASRSPARRSACWSWPSGSASTVDIDAARAAALPGAAVRARAGDAAPRRSAGSSRAATLTVRPGERAADHALLPSRRSRVRAVRRRARQSCYRRDHRGARGLGGQAHARRRHGRRVPVRRHRLDRDRGARDAAQPEPDHVHHRLRARGLLGGRRRGRVGRGDRRRGTSSKVVSPSRVDRGAARRSSGTSTTRSPTRRWCRCTSSPARRASTSRWCCPARAPTSCSAATRSTGNRCRCAPFEYLPGRCARPAGQGVHAAARRACAARSLLHRGSLTLEERYYGNARSFRDAQLRAVLPRRSAPEWTHTDVTAPVYAAVARAGIRSARMQHIDLFTWLRGDILVKADKMTMANSLELRVPFLDPEVFAVASRLPLDGRRSPGPPRSSRCAGAGAASCPRTCCTGPSWASRCRSGTGCADELLRLGARHHRATSQADDLVDLGRRARACSTTTATAPIDHSRRLWTVLVFMLWHGIFVEQRITPQIPSPPTR